MPDEVKPQEGAPDVAAHNANIKQTLENQGRESVAPDSVGLQESNAALDQLAKQAVEKKAKVEETPVEPAAPAAPEPPVVSDEEKAKAEAERAELEKKSQDIFKEAPSLPPGASPKSSEAFAYVKMTAAREIAARDREIEAVKTQIKELEAKLQQGNPDLEKELEDHRTWRARIDVEADPKFREFDKQATQSRDFIYAQLEKSPNITKETIELIKKHGGPDNVKMEKIFDLIKDPTTQRLVEAKLADIEMAKFNKEQAIRSAKENVQKYLAEREASFTQGMTKHNETTQKEFSQLSSKLPWFVEKPVDPKADEPTRKALEAHNAFVKETQTQLASALKDDSPQMRAVMLAGMAQLLYLQRVRAQEKVFTDSLQKQLTEANAKLEKFTNASGGATRIRESSAPQGGGRIEQKPKDGLDMTPATEALDVLAKQVTGERARKGV